MTTIKVPKALRDRLSALADEHGRGTTLADALTRLLDEHEATQVRRRMAFEEILTASQADPEAVAKGTRMAARAIEYLQRRKSLHSPEATT
ncbi:hypothetical protein DP939_01565 [Spongiactinospora rosea]|uniref:Uncharacterized protein n=2 Tax=Spongiactinospora rosea TaxID=2248750 RepID=A0A366M6S7_9ACTN|nr:hypothetical protein DP939_01565 [Spongiactinospora rosea]